MTSTQHDNLYDEAIGPKLWTRRQDDRSSPHARLARTPRNLERSPRVGISRRLCAGCRADCNERPIRHASSCSELASQSFGRVRVRIDRKM